jgi:hypothetical protein
MCFPIWASSALAVAERANDADEVPAHQQAGHLVQPLRPVLKPGITSAISALVENVLPAL